MVDRHAPIKTGRFEVQIDEVEVPGFETVDIPSISVETGNYREGNSSTKKQEQTTRKGNEAKHEKKLWGQVTYDDLEMERGFDPDFSELVEWRRAIQAGKADEGRKEIYVKLLNEEGKVQLQWEFRQAWIKNYEPPDLDASADGETATESVTIAFDEMIRTEGERT